MQIRVLHKKTSLILEDKFVSTAFKYRINKLTNLVSKQALKYNQ
jgi:hypothetical protein